MPFLFKRTKHTPTSKDNFTSSQQLRLRKSISITPARRLADGTHESKSIFRRKTLAGTVSSMTPDAPLPYSYPYSKSTQNSHRGFEGMDTMPLDPYRFTELLLRLQAASARGVAGEGQFPYDDVGTGGSELKAPPPTPLNHGSLGRRSRHGHHHHQQTWPSSGVGVGLGEITASASIPHSLQVSPGVSTVHFPCVESNKGVEEGMGGEGEGGYRSLVGVSIAIMEGHCNGGRSDHDA